MKDTYRTISQPSSQVLFKDRNSKFYAYAFPVTEEGQIKIHLKDLKKQHYQAGHFCYAWVLGKKYERFRANDDGEPGNSAGAPIYGQLQSLDLTNALIVVVRYYGGTKLGISGLINAYKTSAKMALAQTKIEERTIDVEFKISFEYPILNTVMRLIKDENLKIIDQKMTQKCEFTLAIRAQEAGRIQLFLKSIYGVDFIEQI